LDLRTAIPTGNLYTRFARTAQRTVANAHYRCGVITKWRKASIRSSNGGCVLKSDEIVPRPNIGFTMHNAAVEGETEVVGICWL